jgi:uncharacterized protein (TIGR02466 family)
MNTHQLFPTPVAFFDLGRELTSAELDFIVQLPQRSNMGNSSSEDNYIINKSELTELREFFIKSSNEYLQEIYQPKNKTQLRITQSWANYTKPGQFHHKHAHPNSFVSGVFYVQTNPDSDKIYFYKSGHQQIKLKTENFNYFNSDSWWFNSISGQLIMFPSYLEHNVESVAAEGITRISISFNTFPVGTVGDNLELTELILFN